MLYKILIRNKISLKIIKILFSKKAAAVPPKADSNAHVWYQPLVSPLITAISPRNTPWTHATPSCHVSGHMPLIPAAVLSDAWRVMELSSDCTSLKKNKAGN